MRYPLAPNSIFWSVQGEGHLRGFQMCFIRLAGCSVGCDQCDTDYSVVERVGALEIAVRANEATPDSARDRWAWITGGEPADYDLRPLLSALRSHRFSIAIASSGHKRFAPPVDWLSISPHGMEQVQMYGNEIKLVPGLGGLDPWEWCKRYDATSDFWYRYVQPMEIDGVEVNLDECKRFLADHPNWALSRQDHKHWEYP